MVIRSMDELNLHDSDVLRIVIPRKGEGHDTVEVHVSYIEDYDARPLRVAGRILRFRKCWRVWLDMPMRSFPGAALRGGSTLTEDPRIDQERALWRILDAPASLALHTLELDAGTLTVLCESVTLDAE